MRSSNIYIIFVGTILVLLVPLVAMMFTDEVDWNLFDFLVIGTLLIGTGLVYEFITSKINRKHKTTVAIILLAALLLAWAELAVGIFGSPFAGS